MPFAQADLEKFVTELGLPADKAKVVLDAIGSDEGVRNKFGDNVLRKSDYSAKMNEFQKEKERLEADYQKKVREEDAFHSSMAGWKTEKEKETEKLITAAREEAQSKLASIQQKVRELAQRNGIPEDEIKDLTAVQVEPNTTRTSNDRPRNDNGTYMSVEQFQKEARFYAKLPALQMGMEREYYRLFGNDAPAINWDKLIDDSAANRKSLQAQFEETYKVPEKRAEVAETRRKDELDKARKEGEEAALAKFRAEHPEISTRSVTREVHGSPILDRARAHAKESKDHAAANGQQEAVSAAVKAFNEGKYREGQAA